MTGIALDAVQCVSMQRSDGSREIDIKRFVRVEKIPGGEITESRVIRGVILNKAICLEFCLFCLFVFFF